MIPIFLTSGPNEVICVSGIGHNKPALISGGRILVFPGFQTWSRLSLNVMTLEVSSPDVYTLQGVPIRVTGVAQVKIASQPVELLELACENFLSKSVHAISGLLTDTLEGHQRGIMGSMTVEDIYKNRKLFNSRVFDVASKDLLNMGVTVMSYTIRDINDSVGYLKVLGEARTASVMKDARIGEAIAKMEAMIKQTTANETLAKHQYSNKTQVAEAERDFMVQKAGFDVEVQTQKAISEFAYKLQESITRQKIREEEMQTMVVERMKKIEIQEEELKRRAKELESQVTQPADAERYRMETIAEASRKQLVIEAEAKAEGIRLKAEAQRDATMALAKAEFEQMNSKAGAWAQYGEAALIQQYLETLPKITAEVGSALSQVKSIKMVSSGDAELGALKITKEVQKITTSVPEMVTAITGVDITKRLAAFKGKQVMVK